METIEPPTLQNLIKSIIKPKVLNSYVSDTIKIVYGNKIIELDNIFGFNTIYDLKLAIYEKFDKEDFAAPNNQLLFFKIQKTAIDVLDFSYKLFLQNPLPIISGREPYDANFVTSDGEKKIMDINIYNNLLLEKRLNISKGNTLYLYFFKDLLDSYTGPTPISEKQYYGRFYPYFPFLKINQKYPNESEKSTLNTIYNLYSKKQEYLKKIQYLLTQDNPLITFNFAGLRYLRLTNINNTIDDSIDSLFYTIDVNDSRPYLRLLPVGSSPITKIQLRDISNNIPNVINPNYLKNWSEEKSPTPERDYILGKIALKATFLALSYIYATIRILDDASFDVIIEPPSNIKKIDPIMDFEHFNEDITNGLNKIMSNDSTLTLGSGNFIFGIKLAKENTIRKFQLEKRLQLFKPFFQEISPLPNEQPLMMLRYKLVDNYTTEDNISSYLTLLTNKKILKGEESVSQMIELIVEEFQLDYETAKNKVSDWLIQKDEVQAIISGETKTYTPFNNSGIDIAIFQKDSIYTFHLYNVDNVTNLQRIITALSLVFSLEDELLTVSKKDVKTLEIAENKVDNLPRSRASSVVSSHNEGDSNSLPEFDADLMFESETTDAENVENIKEAIAKDIDPPDITLRNLKIKQPPPVNPVEEIKEKGLANFFIKKLQETDRTLFEYNAEHPSEKTYVQMCAANEMRQPAVLTQEQYDIMIDEYKDDDVIFQLYPLPEGQKDIVDKRSDPDNIVTILRYGSNPRKENYYICSELFCTKDEIVVLKDDFKGTRLRRPLLQANGITRTTKPPNTCPFCMGKLVTNRKNPGIGETILQRIPKPKTTKRHVWINFLKKTSHPQALKLPCCFVSPHTITFKDTQSGFLKKKTIKAEEDEEEEELEVLESGVPVIDYTTTLYRINKKYIIGIGERYLPLEIGDRDGPQIGLLPKELNEFFQQDPVNLISRVGNPQKVLPNAKGFLRIGVENRKRYQNDSFLAAIAPFFIKNSASQMKKRLFEIITPALFITLNYGNLVLEFYDPDYNISEVTNKTIWAYKNLNVEYNDNNSQEIIRIIKSYYKFKDFLLSDTTVKEYRQFAHLLSQPKLVQEGLNRPGINFIILDIKEDNTIHVRCPPFGYNMEFMRTNDIAFILHHYSGTYEPIFYIDNLITGLESRIPYILSFQFANAASWPSIVKDIYGQYMKACNGPSKIIYTGQSYINPNTLIPLSLADSYLYRAKKRFNNFTFDGVLRDSYNHVVGIVCVEKRGDRNLNIFVPVIDDGISETTVNKKVYLTYDDIPYESVEDTIRIYKTYILSAFPRYREGYAPKNIALDSNKNIVGLQLNNLLIVPVSKAKSSNVTLPIIQIDEFEWEINREIVFGSDTTALGVIKGKEIEEIYQHLRITFSNWLEQKGSSVKRNLEDDIIFNSTISLNNKRKRLLVLFGSLIQNWFSTETSETPYTSLLRKDCLVQSEDTCSDKCVFTSQGKCKIHVTEKYKDVNLANLLMFRLFDELLRYAEKRKEIFKNEVSKLVFLDKPIRIGDQYILPEDSIEWSEFLRFAWAQDTTDKPKFFEELSREISSSEFVEMPEEETVIELPNYLKAILGPENTKTKSLKYYELTKDTNLNPVLDYLDLVAEEVQYSNTPYFSQATLYQIGIRKKSSIIMINLTKTDFDINQDISFAGKKNIEIKNIYIIVISPTSSGLLVKNNKLEPLRFDDLPTIIKNLLQ